MTKPTLVCDHFGIEALAGGEIVRLQAVLTLTAETEPRRMSLGITMDARQVDVRGMAEEDQLAWVLDCARERLARATRPRLA